MNPAKRARLQQIPAQLKALANEALEILESDEYFASQSQWRGTPSAGIARLEKAIGEQLHSSSGFSPGREAKRGTDHWD